jgi:AraC family transcriptional regulator, transcriptional activator of pobA
MPSPTQRVYFAVFNNSMKAQMIPIHDFSKDGRESIPFRYIPLNKRSDYDITEAHRHNYFEIFLFAKGGGKHEIDFGAHEISDSSIHFVSPGQVHKVRREPDSYGSILLFSRDFYHFGAKTDLSLFEYPFLNTHTLGSPVVNLEEKQFEELLSLSRAMGEEKTVNDPTGKEVIRTYLHIFLLKCKQYAERLENTKYDESLQYFHKLKHLLEECYRNQHLPSYYADELSISSKKLNEICKAYSGNTVNNLIKDRIMLEAKRLLLHSDYSVKEISYFLGFDDPAYFNRFFRKNLEMSAGTFRKNGQEEVA